MPRLSICQIGRIATNLQINLHMSDIFRTFVVGNDGL